MYSITVHVYYLWMFSTVTVTLNQTTSQFTKTLNTNQFEKINTGHYWLNIIY